VSIGPAPSYSVCVATTVEGKRVTWAEGLFDLVVVIAVTQVATLLGEHHQWWGLGRAVVILALVYRTWVLTSLQSNRLGDDSIWDRVTLFGVALCGVVMAIAIPQAYDEGAIQFALAFWAARTMIWGRFVSRYQAKLSSSLGLSVFLIGPVVVMGALAPADYREMIWLLAALIDMGMVAFFGRQHGLIHYDHGHLMERYGLFVLIALGESLVDLSLPSFRRGAAVRPEELLAAGVCFVVVCLLWWTYFDHANAAISAALAGVREHVVLSRHLAYGHFGIIGGIVIVAVGFEDVVSQPGATMSFTNLNLLFGGAILMLVSMVYLRWVMARQVRAARVGAVVALMVLLVVGQGVPAIIATSALAVVLLGLVVMERRWPTFASWPGTQPTGA
jgi:low temperature requirement protein LtrA